MSPYSTLTNVVVLTIPYITFMPYGLVKKQAVQEESLLALLDPEGESIKIL